MTCASCHQHLQFSSLAGHQPAIASAASMDSTVDEGETGPAAASAAASSSAAAAAIATASSSSSAGAAAATVAAVASDLLPPLVPPCNVSEACPRGCEDPTQPGSVCLCCTMLAAARICVVVLDCCLIFTPCLCALPLCFSRVSVCLRSQRLAHERTCAQRPVSCTLCDPAHTLTPRQLVSHVRAVWEDSLQRKYAQQQVVKLLVKQSALADPAGTVAGPFTAAAAASATSSIADDASVSPSAPRLRDGGRQLSHAWAHNSGLNEMQAVARDSSRLQPLRFARSAPQSAAAAAAASPDSGSGFAAAFAPIRALGQLRANRVPPAAVMPSFGYQLHDRDLCDCLDTDQGWRLSEVIGSDATHLLIHYGQCGPSAIGDFSRCVAV